MKGLRIHRIACALAASVLACSSGGMDGMAGMTGSDGGTSGRDGGSGETVLCSRYQLLDAGTHEANGPCPGSRCDGSGLVKDRQTGLTWLRYDYLPQSGDQNQSQAAAYCTGRSMRLPTLEEALAISGTGCCPAAFPGPVSTLTSTAADTGLVWMVTIDPTTKYDTGIGVARRSIDDTDYTLCVK